MVKWNLHWSFLYSFRFSWKLLVAVILPVILLALVVLATVCLLPKCRRTPLTDSVQSLDETCSSSSSSKDYEHIKDPIKDGLYLPSGKLRLVNSLLYSWKNTVQWYSTMIQYKLQWYSTMTQYNDTVQWHGTMIQYNDTVQWYGTMIRYNDTVQWYGTILSLLP